MRTQRSAIVCLSLVGMLASESHAQTIVHIDDDPQCATCSIDLRPVVRLGSIEDPAGFGPLVQLTVNSRDQYVASSPTFNDELFVYGSDGKLLRSIGRSGAGPGEFSRTQFVAFDAQDSLHVVEMSGARYTVFTPDYELARTAVVEARTLGVEVEPAGTLYIVSPSAGSGAQNALQVFPAAGGASIQSFDPIDPEASGQAALGRNIAVGRDGSRWSVRHTAYRISQWDGDGELIRQFDAERDWLSETLPMRLDLSREKPPGQISGLELDDSGLLWVFAAVPDANWKPVQPGTRPEPNDLYDTLIEVVDPGDGTFVARTRTDALVIPFVNGGAYSVVEESSGDRRIQVWELVVSR